MKASRAAAPAALALSVAAMLLAGCATPKELKQPIGRPVMGAAADPDPLPAYVTPQPEGARTDP